VNTITPDLSAIALRKISDRFEIAFSEPNVVSREHKLGAVTGKGRTGRIALCCGYLPSLVV
jgi:hypothetical protein